MPLDKHWHPRHGFWISVGASIVLWALIVWSISAKAATFDANNAMRTSNFAASAQSTPTVTSNLVVTGNHVLLGFHVTETNTNGGRAMIFSGTSAPSDGAVSPSGCFTVPALVSPQTTATLSMANAPIGVQVLSGIVVVFSSGADCYTLTKSATAFISVSYQ